MQAEITRYTDSLRSLSIPLRYVQNLNDSASHLRAALLPQKLYHPVAFYTFFDRSESHCSTEIDFSFQDSS